MRRRDGPLTPLQQKLLTDFLRESRPDLLPLMIRQGFAVNDPNTRYEMQLVLTDALCRVGLGPNSEHNEVGLEIEDMIDYFSNA